MSVVDEEDCVTDTSLQETLNSACERCVGGGRANSRLPLRQPSPSTVAGNEYCCTACRSDNRTQAIGKCLTCTSLLCKACVFAHKFMICFQGHTVVPLPVVTTGELTDAATLERKLCASNALDPDIIDCYSSANDDCCSRGFARTKEPVGSSMLESHCQSQLNELVANLGLSDRLQIPPTNSFTSSLLTGTMHDESSNATAHRNSLQFNQTNSLGLEADSHFQNVSGNAKATSRSISDLLLLIEKAGSVLQIQHWRAALKINEAIESFKDELESRRQSLMKSLDDALEQQQRKLSEMSKESRANMSNMDLKARLDITSLCERLCNNQTLFFEFVSDQQAIKKAVQECSGHLKIRLFEGAANDGKVSSWNNDSFCNNLSSGYSSLSGGQAGQAPSYIYPSSNSDLSGSKRSSAYLPDNQESTSLAAACRTSDIASHWSSSDPCYWLQDPCWSSDGCSVFSSTTDTFQPEPKRPQSRRRSDISGSLMSICKTSAAATAVVPDADESPVVISPLQNRFSDIAASLQSSESSLTVGSGCCCATRPISSIRRQKMVYHCKFGEFGGLEGQFTEPSGVAVNLQSDIIVADTNNHRIQIFDRDGRYKFRFGECGKRDGQLLYPNRVAVFKLSGDIVVTERSPTHQVQIFNQSGHFVRKFGSTVLQHPRGVCVDPSGNIIVAECKVMRVFVFDRFGNTISRFNCSKHLEFPNSVCANDKQEIFISDNRAHCVKVFSYDGRLIRTLGGEGITNFPIGVGLDNSGNVLVADNHNNFNLTLFSQSGQLLAALESKVKHAQCFDAAIMDSCGSVVLSSKDYHIYIYRYMPVTSFPPEVC